MELLMRLKEIAGTPVEAWGYMYDARDRRQVWRRKFPSEPAARAWADFYNATIMEIKPLPRPGKEEQLDELSFLGSPCTKDCSGHRAGYEWSARKGNIDAASWSDSFNRGARLRATGN